MILEYDDLFESAGVYFLPWIGNGYHGGFRGHRLLVLGESHYAEWDDADEVKRAHHCGQTFTRERISEVCDLREGAQFWRYLEQILLNEDRESGWPPNGGAGLWDQFALYNFVQSPVPSGARRSPTNEQFAKSRPQFRAVLEGLRPERVLVCGKRLWREMEPTDLQVRDDVRAYRLHDGSLAWCLAIVHPSAGQVSWRDTHQLLKAFIDEPELASVGTRIAGA
jgi:hypothetical protein